jgi:peptide/nickel transport system permease protein
MSTQSQHLRPTETKLQFDQTTRNVRARGHRGRRWAAVLAITFGFLLSVTITTSGVAEQTNLLDRFAAPSWSNPAGTDQFGRDVLSLVGAGALSTLGLATAVVSISAIFGSAVALLGASGRFQRVAVVSIGDTLLSVPTLVIALVVAATIGSGTGALLLALSSVGWTPYFRLVLAQIDTAQQQLWVEAAIASGAGRSRVLVRHIFPNVAAPLIALSAARIGHAVVSVSALSFLGVGPQPPSPEWGSVLAAAQPYAERAPWAVIAPSLAILLTRLAFLAGRLATERLRQPPN